MSSEERRRVSVVISVYNEEKILEELHNRLTKVAGARPEQFEFIFVNDGGTDGSLKKLLELNRLDKRVSIIDLARNFGHQNALTAGLDKAEGDAVVLMDADMEDYPEDILKFLKKWDEGYQVVYAMRKSRKVPFPKLFLFKLFHIINARISMIKMGDTGTFGLMDRVVVEVLKRIREHNRYIPGLRSWIGFNQIGVEVERGPRYDAAPRLTIYNLYKLAFDSFTSLSYSLLSLPFFIGLILSLLSIVALVVIVVLKIIYNIGPWGWASLISIVILFAGLQLAFIGFLGEYISRIFMELKDRPLYIIKKIYK